MPSSDNNGNVPCPANRLAAAGFWERDFESDQVTWSEDVFRLLGFEPGSVQPTLELLLACVHPDDLAGRERSLFGAADDSRTVDCQFRVVHPGGRMRWLANKGEVFVDSKGASTWASGALIDITDIREAQAELEAREQRFRALAAVNAIGAWRANADGKIIEAPFWGAFIGQDAEKGIDNWLEAVHPEDVEGARSLWEEALRIGCSVEFSFRARYHTGEYRWVRFKAVPIMTVDDRVSEWIGSTVDTQEEHETKISLRVHEERLRVALDAGGMMAWDYDLGTGYVTRSRNSVPLTGAGSGTLSELAALLPDNDRIRLCEAIKRATEPGQSFKFEYSIADQTGQTRWFHSHGNLVRMAHLCTDRLVGVTLDVTADKIAEAEVRASREQVREMKRRCHALEQVAGGFVWTASLDGKVEDIPGWRDFTGQTATEVREWGWLSAVHPADREPAREAILSQIDSFTGQTIDYRVRSRSGQYRWFRSRAAPLMLEDGRISGWLGVCQPWPEPGEMPGKVEGVVNIAAADLQLTSGAQVRAARAILRWSVHDLAHASGVSSSTIRRIEEEEGVPQGRELSKVRMIRATLEEAGVRFGPVLGKGGVAPS